MSKDDEANLAPPDPTRLWAGRVLAGVRLEERLGRGGSSYALRGTRLTDGADVVFKVLLRKHRGVPRKEARLLREAAIMNMLDHPHVMSCLDSGRAEGLVYLVMPYRHGVPLDRVIEDGALPRADALEAGRQVLSALAHVHERGIVHRDVKPQNVLRDPTHHCFLADFGLAITEEERRLAREAGIGWKPSRVGTNRYRAPEQARTSRGVDGRADLYSYGVFLHRLLTTRFPTDPEDPADLPELHHSVPDDLRELIERCLEPDPEDRWASAEELMEEFPEE